MKNKKGWLKVAEAFMAVLIVAGVVLLVISRSETQNVDISPGVRDVEVSILREVQLNSTLRAEVLATTGEVEWTSFSSAAPGTKAKVEIKTPVSLDCSAKICNPSSSCSLNSTTMEEKNVYVESAMITSTLSNFNPRILKIFCWEKSS